MKYNPNIKIEELLSKPLWQMSGREFCALTQYANSQVDEERRSARQVLCHGMKELADYLGCSVSKVYTLSSGGILKDAVVSHVGKAIVFDGQKALELANENKTR